MLNFALSPRKIVSDQEYHQLVVIALTDSGHSADDNDRLFYELDRAQIVLEADLPPDVVRPGSAVTYRDNEGDMHTVRLVYPQQAHPELGRVSVLTSLGTKLLGLQAGQSVSYRSRNGRNRALTAVRVTPIRYHSEVLKPQEKQGILSLFRAF
jgi:regulator of nucleoside diphosphate kinase